MEIALRNRNRWPEKGGGGQSPSDSKTHTKTHTPTTVVGPAPPIATEPPVFPSISSAGPVSIITSFKTITAADSTTTPTPSSTAQDSTNSTPLPSPSPSTTVAALPPHAIAPVVVASLMGLAFLVALALFCDRERRRPKDDSSSSSSGRRSEKPNYAWAAGRALAVATGLFVPIWAAQKVRAQRRAREERRRQQLSREIFDRMAVYRKLEEEGEGEGVGGWRAEDAAVVDDRAVLRDVRDIRGNYGAGYLGVRDMRGGRGGGAAAALSPSMPLNRSESLVSSLSSESEGGQGRYERLNRSPSPMTEVTSVSQYSWRSRDRPYVQGRVEGNRGMDAVLMPDRGGG